MSKPISLENKKYIIALWSAEISLSGKGSNIMNKFRHTLPWNKDIFICHKRDFFVVNSYFF